MSCDLIDPDAQIALPSAGMNPLDRAGYSRVRSSETTETTETTDGVYHAGDYVEVAQPETPLFPHYPRSGARAQKYLGQGVVLNVLGLDRGYMHVQNEQGDEGYVSTAAVVPQGLLVADLPLSEIEMAEIDVAVFEE